MSNHIGFFNGTGAVSNQPNESKIKATNTEAKDVEYFKVGLYCEGAYHDNRGDVTEKRVESEIVVGVDKDFKWLPLQKYLKIHSANAEKALKRSNVIIRCESKWYRVPTKKTKNAVILDKNNMQEQVNELIGNFCHSFNGSIGKATNKKIHTEPFEIDKIIQEDTPTL